MAETNKEVEDLKAENESLKQENSNLKGQLTKAKKEIKKLGGDKSPFKSWDAAIQHYMKEDGLSYQDAYRKCDKEHKDLVG